MMKTPSARRLHSLLCVALLLASGICMAAYNVWTNEYTFPKQALQTALDGQFPRTLRYLNVFDVSLSNPHLLLNAGANRVNIGIDARIDNPLLMNKPVNGTLSLSSALRYDPAARAVRLDSPSVDKIDIAGVPAQYAPQLNAIGNAVAEQILKNYALYTFKPEQLKMNGQRFEPGAITVLEDGIKVEIRPL